MSTDTSNDMRRALAAGLSGYLIWGISPLFFQTLDFASAVEIILHRVIWAVPLLAGSLALSGRLRAALGVLADRRTLLTLLATSALISVNWWGFIYAVNSGHVLQASLGYYINPLMSVAVGVIILREPLGPWRIAAISLAALGVANQILTVGEVPWISLMLATTFTAYGYLRKVAAVDGRVGLLWETLFILPFAIIGFAWLQASGTGHFFETPLQSGLLIAAGAVTVIPLLLYTIGVRGLRLSTMGLLQFIAPTLQFSIGVMGGETFETGHLITFALIWTGVGCFTWSQIRRERKLDALAEDA
ncbi:EamA family transporter RarD [Maricaulis sp.]|uniref:EamA family transporter RarD n=1 Tax=Maricaulis sp. TaxID=1486257 RepID=UPI0025C1030F|nr:EamA family transporter RarD [Maricaulis sp.]